MSIAYIPLTSLPSTRSETTSFDQVYGVRRRRPTSINLRLSNTHRWSGSEIDRQRETFYTAQSMGDLARPTAVTPPSSDYTDAYLSAFAPQPISARYLHRVTAPRFISAPFGSLGHHLIRTSPTRFNPTTILAEAPPQLILHESVEREPSLSSITDRPESPYENLPGPTLSPVKMTYKPCVSFRSAPLPFVQDLPSSSTTTETVLPSLPIREKLDRPETILFRHDEDIQSSPVVSPMLDSSLTSEPVPVELRSSLSEESAPVSSKPITILENTLSKYESIINQISEVLASVSPLSSTISSMSPSRSALDYDLSSDSSPILPHRSAETNASPIASVTTTACQPPSSHLIRGDSYDKIVTAIADLDEELEETLDESSAVSTIVEEPLIAYGVIIDSTVSSTIELVLINKRKDKCVTWDETVVDNEDDESVPSETSTHELQSTMSGSDQPEPQDITSEEQTVSMDSIGQREDDVFISEITDSTLIASESTILENQTRFSLSPDTSSSFSDSLEHSASSCTALDSRNLDLHTEDLQLTPVESEWLLVTNNPSPAKSVVDTSLNSFADVNLVVVDDYQQSNENTSEFHLVSPPKSPEENETEITTQEKDSARLQRASDAAEPPVTSLLASGNGSLTDTDSTVAIDEELRFPDPSAVLASLTESVRLREASLSLDSDRLSVKSNISTPPPPSISETADTSPQSSDELKFDSVSQHSDVGPFPMRSVVAFRDLSLSNTDIDSLELIHALRGHSIAAPGTSPSVEPEQSSNSTPSSQVTSSDRYVSYAIHEMGDSSQDRLPAAIPIAADLPVYQSAKERVVPKPFFFAHRPSIKEEDVTELDATDHMTSFTDEILLQRLYNPARQQREQFDASSTDEDVDDEEFEQQSLNHLHDIIDQSQHASNQFGANNESYQRYDLATTPSSNDDSSSSSRQQTDDVYLIPGYPGLWRPSTENAPMNYDADDERRTESKTRTIVRTTDPARLQSFFHHQHEQAGMLPYADDLSGGIPLRSSETKEIPRMLIDASESDSFYTCPSSQSKQEQETSELRQESPDDKILLIRQRERGISLPVLMKINCDDLPIRLSTSTPTDAPVYWTVPAHLSSLNSPDGDEGRQREPSWLISRTTAAPDEEPMDPLTTLRKTTKGPISIAECDTRGNSITIENISRSKNIDLANWTLRQENEHGQAVIFAFPDPCLLRYSQSLKIWTTTKRSEQKQDDLVATEIVSWYTGSRIITTLSNSEGKDCATWTKTTLDRNLV